MGLDFTVVEEDPLKRPLVVEDNASPADLGAEPDGFWDPVHDQVAEWFKKYADDDSDDDFESRIEFYNKNQPRAKDGKWTKTGGARGSTSDKMWSGMSAHPDHRTAPTPDSKIRQRMIDDPIETARGIYESGDLGDGVVTMIDEDETSSFTFGDSVTMHVKGYIMKGDESVGYFERDITFDEGVLSVHHTEMVIEGPHQGSGIADRFNTHVVSQYQKLGVDHISLEAGLETGGYAWARQGFRFDDHPDRSSQTRKEFIQEMLGFVANKRQIPVVRPHVRKLLKDIRALEAANNAGEDIQPIHIASIGERYARYSGRTDDQRVYQTWPGKSTLLGRRWAGVFYFDAAAPVTAAATDLAHSVLRPASGASRGLTEALTDKLKRDATSTETPYPLAQIERSSMIALKSLMQRHLSSLGVTAAIDPSDLITDQMEAEYLALAVSLWDEVNDWSTGFGLDTLPFERYYPIVKEAIETSRNRYIDIFKALIGKQADTTPLYGEFFFVPDYVSGTGLKPPAPYEVQFGDVRQILAELGGGGPAEVPLSTGITGGRIFQDVLRDNGLGTDEKLWLYGETARRTFNGHLQVDGLVFTDWNDEALEIAPQDHWIRTDRYRPGDHWGCACVVVPYVPNFGDPFPMTVGATVASSNGSETFTWSPVAEEFYNPAQPRDKDGQWTTHRGRLTSLSSERLDRAYGGGAEGVFGNSHTTTTIPWPSAPRRKGERVYDPDLVQKALSGPIVPEPVDPRLLYGTQPGLVRTHFDHYLKGEKGLAADQNVAANAQPIVYVNSRGQHILLTGHHRAAAALAKGEDLMALVVREAPVRD